MRLKVVVALSLYLLLICSAFAQAPTSSAALLPKRDPEAVKVLQGAASVHGDAGIAGIRDTKALVKITSYSADGTPVAVDAVIISSGNSIRIETTGSDGGTQAFVANETSAWNEKPGAKPEFQPRKSVAPIGNTHLPSLVLNADIKNPNSDVSFKDAEPEDAKGLKSIVVTRHEQDSTSGDERYEVAINGVSGLVQQLIYHRHAPSNLKISVPIQVNYSDYRQIHGVAIPFHVEQFIRGHLASSTDIKSFDVNVGVDTSIFQARVN
ncbi:MAG: hypothetical protein JWO13_518 [Acidobacteriales bacterium]|nr:hypothetical protein [Terriglobales bacterium]